MGVQEITLLVVGSIIVLIYLASRILEEDCKELEAKMGNEK